MSFKSSPKQGQGEYLILAKSVLSRLPGNPPPSEPGSRPDPVAIARLLGMPLDRFALEGAPMEVKVPWLDVTLWFVPTEVAAEALAQEGIGRGRIWTAHELADLLSLSGLTKEQAWTIARVKLEFLGEITEVCARPPEPTR